MLIVHFLSWRHSVGFPGWLGSVGTLEQLLGDLWIRVNQAEQAVGVPGW